MTLIRVLYILLLFFFSYPFTLSLTVQIPKTGRREVYKGTRMQGCTKDEREEE